MTRLFAFGMIALFETAFLPMTASAQPPAPIVDQTSRAPVETQVTTARDPHRYLTTAHQQLQAVPTQNLSKEAKKKLDQLREDFDSLVASYQGRASLGSTPPASGTKSAAASDEAISWKLRFDAVERGIVSILGAGPELGAGTTPAVAGTTGVVPVPDVNRPSQPMVPGAQPVGSAAETAQAAQASAAQPVGGASAPTVRAAQSPAVVPDAGAAAQAQVGAQTTQAAGSTGAQAGAGALSGADAQAAGLAGVAVGRIGVKNLDPAVRQQLEEVRNSVEMFYDATTSLRHR